MAKPPAKPDMSDAAVAAKTGKGWDEWFSLLDAAGAQKHTHKEIVAILAEQHGVAPWWRQMVTVQYERARGLRAKGETTEGFQVSASRTVAAPLAGVYRAWSDARTRKRWLPPAELKPLGQTPEQRVSFIGAGDSRVEVRLVAKNAEKTLVTVQERKLATAAAGKRQKAYWAAALDALQAHLEQ
jgi:hypothetical protein